MSESGGRRKTLRRPQWWSCWSQVLFVPSPVASYFGSCGGCKWQHVDYAAQLDAKRQSVKDALEHTGGFEGIEVQPTRGAEDIFYYRNKMEYSFSASRWLTTEEIASGEKFNTDFALGMHVPGRFDRVIDLDACFLPDPISMEIVNGLRRIALSEWLDLLEYVYP